MQAGRAAGRGACLLLGADPARTVGHVARDEDDTPLQLTHHRRAHLEDPRLLRAALAALFLAVATAGRRVLQALLEGALEAPLLPRN